MQGVRGQGALALEQRFAVGGHKGGPGEGLQGKVVWARMALDTGQGPSLSSSAGT